MAGFWLSKIEPVTQGSEVGVQGSAETMNSLRTASDLARSFVSPISIGTFPRRWLSPRRARHSGRSDKTHWALMLHSVPDFT